MGWGLPRGSVAIIAGDGNCEDRLSGEAEAVAGGQSRGSDRARLPLSCPGRPHHIPFLPATRTSCSALELHSSVTLASPVPESWQRQLLELGLGREGFMCLLAQGAEAAHWGSPRNSKPPAHSVPQNTSEETRVSWGCPLQK